MKFLYFIVVILGLPLFAGAHGMMNFNEIQSGNGMMQYVEEQAVGSELHEEMESLMIKTLSGSLSEEEAGRMVELMNQYPGAGSMMMNRMVGTSSGLGWGMMGWGVNAFWNFWSVLTVLMYTVWLTVGILAVVWLWRNIAKK